jgi:hypothetical protein
MSEDTVKTSEELRKVLSEVTMRNSVLDFKWEFHIGVVRRITGVGDDGWLVQVSFERPDTATGIVGVGFGRKEFVPYGATVSGVVKTAWLLIELMVRHELMEGFRWRGCRIFNPHHRVDELASIETDHK